MTRFITCRNEHHAAKIFSRRQRFESRRSSSTFSSSGGCAGTFRFRQSCLLGSSPSALHLIGVEVSFNSSTGYAGSGPPNPSLEPDGSKLDRFANSWHHQISWWRSICHDWKSFQHLLSLLTLLQIRSYGRLKCPW
jgi:hypothetical protein